MLAIVLVSFASAADASETLSVVRVGVMAGGSDAFISAVGIELGIYEKYGLDVKSYEFSAGINTIDALTLGQLDFGMAADFAILNRIGGTENSDLRIYTKLALSLTGTPNSWQFYVKDDSVKSVADLSGKSIALQKGTVAEYWTARLLEVGGVESDSVKLLPVGSSQEAVAIVKSGRATGTWLSGQGGVAIRQAEGARSIADLGTINAQTVTVLLSTKKFLAENHESVVGFIKALDEIVKFILAEPEKTAEIVQKRLNIPKEQVLIDLQRSELEVNFTQEVIDTLDSINKWAYSAGFIKTVFDPRDYVDVSALKEAFPDRVRYK
jgi:NitT/TauT family transport system substrate-binding protein